MIVLALRCLQENKRGALLALLSVFFATLACVAVSGFIVGDQDRVVQQLVNSTAQIRIRAREDHLAEHELDQAFYGSTPAHVFWDSPPSGAEAFLEVQNPESWYARLHADPRVEAFSPLLTAPALFHLGKISASGELLGCNPEQQAKVTRVAQYMIDGRFEDISAGGARVILGDELAKRLGATLNQIVWISVRTNSPVAFKVVGRFATGNREADLQAYASLSDVQRINRMMNRVNEIAVRLKDHEQAAGIASDWSKIALERTDSWDQRYMSILSVFAVQTALRFAVILIALMVAGVGIYGFLNGVVARKPQEILIFTQGLMIGICGAVLGLIAGYALCWYLQAEAHFPISFSPWIYVQAALFVLLTSLLASVLPAQAARRFVQ